MRSLTVNTEPAAEPVSIEEAKDHLRLDEADDYTLVGAQITAARRIVEKQKGRALVTQTLDLWLDGFPAGTVIKVPRPPLASVTSIVYYDKDNTEATFSSASYHVDTDAEPGRIILASGSTWPTTSLRSAHSVRVRYVAGYGAAADVPEDDKILIKLLLSHLYENREPVITGTIATELPLGFRALMGDRFIDTLAE